MSGVRARNASAWLLPNHGSRDNATLRRDMRRFSDEDGVDLAVVGCGAGGSVLLQRLARAGWKVLGLEAGRSGILTRTSSATRPGPTTSTGPSPG